MVRRSPGEEAFKKAPGDKETEMADRGRGTPSGEDEKDNGEDLGQGQGDESEVDKELATAQLSPAAGANMAT